MGDLKGLERVVANLNREIKQIKDRSLSGLARGGLLVLRDVELTPPLTPVRLSNLRSSRFLVTSNSKIMRGGSPTFIGPDAGSLASGHSSSLQEAAGMASRFRGLAVVLGFSAKYAAHVHEMIGDVNWTRPDSGPKFFEKAIDRNADSILNLIKKEAMKK